MRKLVWLPILLLCPTGNAVFAQDVVGCGDVFDVDVGPWDYTDPAASHDLDLVNDAHFNADVENLRRGQSGTSIIADLDFILRHFPNHHRALYAVARYQLEGGDREGFRSTECYFDRAMRFQPADGVVRMVYGIYLSQKGDLDAALERYKEALSLMPGSAEVHYNIALLYIDLEDYTAANRHAHEAYSLGHPLPGLRNKLERLGEWQEPESGDAEETQVSNG